MDGLKGASTSIGDDGRTVTVVTESEHTAREVAVQLETQVRKAEGGPGAKFNSWLSKSLNRFDETMGIYGDRLLNIVRDVLTLCWMGLAIFAWYRVLPGYEPLMCIIGATIVFGVKTCASKLDSFVLKKNWVVVWIFSILIVVGMGIEVIASTSLQASVAVDQATGRNDTDNAIKVLEQEQARLNIAQMKLPKGTAAQTDSLVQAYEATPMVSQQGVHLTKTVGVMAEETGCVGRSYYVGIYCPTLLELRGDASYAHQWEADKARLAAIPDAIKALQAQRPHVSSTFALGQMENAWWGGMVIPVGLTILLGITTLTFAYLAGRAEREPPLELNNPVTGAGTT